MSFTYAKESDAEIHPYLQEALKRVGGIYASGIQSANLTFLSHGTAHKVLEKPVEGSLNIQPGSKVNYLSGEIYLLDHKLRTDMLREWANTATRTQSKQVANLIHDIYDSYVPGKHRGNWMIRPRAGPLGRKSRVVNEPKELYAAGQVMYSLPSNLFSVQNHFTVFRATVLVQGDGTVSLGPEGELLLYKNMDFSKTPSQNAMQASGIPVEATFRDVVTLVTKAFFETRTQLYPDSQFQFFTVDMLTERKNNTLIPRWVEFNPVFSMPHGTREYLLSRASIQKIEILQKRKSRSGVAHPPSSIELGVPEMILTRECIVSLIRDSLFARSSAKTNSKDSGKKKHKRNHSKKKQKRKSKKKSNKSEGAEYESDGESSSSSSSSSEV